MGLPPRLHIIDRQVRGKFPPPPPPHSVLFRVRICLFPPFESTPSLRTDKISEPPFRGLFAGFSCLGDPPKSKILLNVPPYILFYNNPLFKFLRHPKRKRKKNHPLFKRNLRVKSQIPPFFYNSRAGLCRTKSTPLPEILGTRMRSHRPRSGGGGGELLFRNWGINTLLKSDVTRRDHVVRCHGSHECWFTHRQFHSQFHSRRHSLRITLKYTTLVCMRSSNA